MRRDPARVAFVPLVSAAVSSGSRAVRWGVRCILPLLAVTLRLPAQGIPVLQLDPQDAYGGALAADRGVAGLRQRLLELRTTASVLQVTAHPDDEQSGVLTLLARGTGARTALLTLNRGEAGANALGSELFDGLGLLRTEELLLADKYYGLDDQYFTAAADYGFSKTMREAAQSWDTTAVLADMVRVIRRNQPLVVVARWYGGARDGHGHHQLAGALTPLAVAAAADPTRFPEQLTREGLTTWRVLRLFRANVPGGERAEVVLDPGRYDPWLGESYQSMGADGISRQRSQTSGRRSMSEGAAPQRWQQLQGTPVRSSDDPFSGIDTSLPSLFTLVGEPASATTREALHVADASSRRGARDDEAGGAVGRGPSARARVARCTGGSARDRCNCSACDAAARHQGDAVRAGDRRGACVARGGAHRDRARRRTRTGPRGAGRRAADGVTGIAGAGERSCARSCSRRRRGRRRVPSLEPRVRPDARGAVARHGLHRSAGERRANAPRVRA